MKFNDQIPHKDFDNEPMDLIDVNDYVADPAEKVMPKKGLGKRWYFRFAAYLLILTFVSGFTFGAGYLTASFYGKDLPGMASDTPIVTSPGVVKDDGISITQVQSIITDNKTGTSTIAGIAQEVSPAIVTIASYSDRNPGGFFGDFSGFYGGTGSGIIFGAQDNELYIVTNYHVIEGASRLEVVFHDGSEVAAEALGYNSRLDIAVLSVPLDQANAHVDEIVMATFGDSDQVQIGELAVAIGNPLGPDYAVTVTAGIISALGRDISIDQNTTQVNLIQTDAAINPGNSGGALLNGKGEVIGINSAKYVDESVEGIGFAIPINDAQETINEILAAKDGNDLAFVLADDRAFLGVRISDITAAINQETGMSFGVYITDILPNSGAEEAGLQSGDIIYSIDGDRINNTSELFSVLDDAKVGDEILIEFVRSDELLEVTAYLYSYKEVMGE
jgi:serine protease Do